MIEPGVRCQPMHCKVLFSTRMFTDGDRGGNSVRTAQAVNLHALWGNFPGRGNTVRAARNRAITYVSNDAVATIGKAAAFSLDESEWLAESYSLAKTVAYDVEVMDALRRMEAGGGSVEVITLSQGYLLAGGQVAEKRLVQAGYRLGAVLKQIAATER